MKRKRETLCVIRERSPSFFYLFGGSRWFLTQLFPEINRWMVVIQHAQFFSSSGRVRQFHRFYLIQQLVRNSHEIESYSRVVDECVTLLCGTQLQFRFNFNWTEGACESKWMKCNQIIDGREDNQIILLSYTYTTIYSCIFSYSLTPASPRSGYNLVSLIIESMKTPPPPR
jgi:hypothetical protein